MSNQADASADTLEQLFVELRRIKQASGLSYGQLADRTHYSRSSWERFLNGKQPPSKVAVEQFAAATGVDPRPLLGLLEPAGQPAARNRELATGEAADALPSAASSAVPMPSDASVGPVVPGAFESAETTRSPLTAQASLGTAIAVVEVPEPALPAEGPGQIARRAPQLTRRLLARRGVAARPSWQRQLRAAGLISVGAVMGAVAAVLAIGSGSGAHVGSAHATGAQASSPAIDRGASVVPAAGKVDVRCSGDTCLRRDPQAMDCQWDATTAHDTWLRGMHIELRYSPACHAVWGRIENGAVGDVVTIKDRTGLELQATIRTDRDTYTQMLAVADDAPAETVTICGAIPSQKQVECSPSSSVQP
ncbi:helix-turn-helix domain-containing protein [Streptomyces sp. NPDC006691]|uniref:helix-turn-helix domain-containing protein n=1 Tax=Streptomyces sp. NPDC006691 TaxID=3364757 RepID=UPI0036881D34